MPVTELSDNRFTGRQVAGAVRRLFESNGTVYLASGYLTWSGYLALLDPMRSFLERDPDNRVVFLVATGADQFSRQVAHDIWAVGDDRVRLLTYTDGFLHPKLYLRDGPEPALVMGSANLTWDGLGKNVELAWYYAPDDPADPIFSEHREWMETFVAASRPVTEADLTWRVRLGRMAHTWLNKGRINLPVMLRGWLPFGGRGRTSAPPGLAELMEEE